MSFVVSPELARVLSAIRKLKPVERRFIVGQIQAQTGQETSAAALPRHSEDWLLPGLEYELRRRGLLMSPLNATLLQRWAPSYSKDAAPIRATLKAKLKTQPTQAELLALGRVCAKVLLDYKIENSFDRTPGPKMLLQGVADLPVALERSFPGYLVSGLLHKLIKV